jgi:hypothetical protein
MVAGDVVLSVLGIFRHVGSLCFKCFSCFRYMFQVFHTDVAKVDRDASYVAIVVHVCCKRYSQCFICLSDICCKCVYLDVVYVSYICCKRFIWMLCMFVMVFKCFQVFLQVFLMYVASVSVVSNVCCMCFI